MHKCVRCGSMYEDYDASILRGCNQCGSIFFLYIKTPRDAEQIEEIKKELEAKETTLEQEITKRIEEKVEEERRTGKKREVEEIKFGIETVRIPREGVYEIDIDALMKKRPLIILERGKVYFIHLPSVFEAEKEI
ncbi:MAG: Zn-ribbon containing protein [Candidatus Aenigmarchaeota archaeon]|nr:Zn-ribbon containing protein [Candidatus Aenigmarchaeota archaeon]